MRQLDDPGHTLTTKGCPNQGLVNLLLEREKLAATPQDVPRHVVLYPAEVGTAGDSRDRQRSVWRNGNPRLVCSSRQHQSCHALSGKCSNLVDHIR
jgi:hypothetical protein